MNKISIMVAFKNLVVVSSLLDQAEEWSQSYGMDGMDSRLNLTFKLRKTFMKSAFILRKSGGFSYTNLSKIPRCRIFV